MKMITSEYKIVSQSVPPGFNGFTVAHVSDLHNREFNRSEEHTSELQSH